MTLDSLGDALRRILDGATGSSRESEVLDVKRDPRTVTGHGVPGSPQAGLIEELVDAVVCFANARGERIVLDVSDRTPGRAAFLGTKADPAVLRNGIYGNTRPQLTVPIDEFECSGARLLVVTVPEGLNLITDSRGRALGRHRTSCAPLTEDARRALAHERRNPDLTARPSDRSWRQASAAAMRQVRGLLSQLVAGPMVE